MKKIVKLIRNNKGKIISTLLTTVSVTLIILSISYHQAIHNYWNATVKSFVDFRTYFVTYNTDIYDQEQAVNKLKQYQHVSGAASSSSYLISMIANDYVSKNMSGTIYLEGNSDKGLQVVLGNHFSDYSENENMIVCAKQFYPEIEQKRNAYDVRKVVDLSDQVGKTISLSFLGESSISESFKVVGLYDARQNYTEGNICYASFATVDKLNRKYQEYVFAAKNPIIMVIDNVEHSDEVLQEIKKDGFGFDSPVVRIDKKSENKTFNTLLIVGIIVIVLTLIINTIIILKNIKNKKNYYMRNYKDEDIEKRIIKKQLFDILITSSASFFLSIPSTIISMYFVQKIYFSSKMMYANVNLSITPLSLLVAFIGCLLISFVLVSITSYKIKKMILKRNQKI